MNRRRLLIPLEPIVAAILIGLLLTGIILYGRSIRLQRFLEPALAVLQPRTTFYAKVRESIYAEFSEPDVAGLQVSGGSVKLSVRLLAADKYHAGEPVALKRLAKAFYSMLRDPFIRANVDIVLVVGRAPIGADPAENARIRHVIQDNAEQALEIMYKAVPELERDFSASFASASVSTFVKGDETQWLEFHIVPSERLHVEVLQRLQKYAR